MSTNTTNEVDRILVINLLALSFSSRRTGLIGKSEPRSVDWQVEPQRTFGNEGGKGRKKQQTPL